MLVIPAFGRLGQEAHDYKASLDYIARSCVKLNSRNHSEWKREAEKGMAHPSYWQQGLLRLFLSKGSCSRGSLLVGVSRFKLQIAGHKHPELSDLVCRQGDTRSFGMGWGPNHTCEKATYFFQKPTVDSGKCLLAGSF